MTNPENASAAVKFLAVGAALLIADLFFRKVPEREASELILNQFSNPEPAAGPNFNPESIPESNSDATGQDDEQTPDDPLSHE